MTRSKPQMTAYCARQLPRPMPIDFRLFQIRGKTIPYIPLIKAPTPVKEGTFGSLHFMIKREDMTDKTVYGGNKVRNLEFILADALLSRKRIITTPIPMGSNFSAAFAGHSLKLGLTPLLCQVRLAEHPQITDHLEFCKALGARMTTREGAFKFPMQLTDIATARIRDDAHVVPPGGSNVFGVLGHLKAFIEVAESIRRGEIRCPDVIFVGAGTGGTTAGLLVGITLTGLPINVIAVRCAEKIICNFPRIIGLANRTLRFLGATGRVTPNLLELIECPGNRRYGDPLDEFDILFRDFYRENGIELDRTYTSKVVRAMASRMNDERGNLHNVLYWHTFSSMASRELQRISLTH